MNSYERMAQIIRYLDEHFRDQPSLAMLAEKAQLSPAHFHREFKRWVGVTPKDFVQGLTHVYAKAMLQQGTSALDTALTSGLSGPGRLHDLCVSLEGVTPGEVKLRGKGLTFHIGSAPSPFGLCCYAESERGLNRFQFETGRTADLEHMVREEWPEANLKRDDRRAKILVDQIFGASLKRQIKQTLHLWLRGTPFQFQVWQALLRLKPSQLTTYGSLASHLGRPTAARAVGSALGANPIAVLIPCHRVIQSTGLVQGYRWGVGRKRALIAWESALSS
ncbi:MAG: Bifunctional transcriptional activator/DNA repair enzyme Ada [Verrucomicrobia subdivision 3 bacterium]|nr:Bifunctional transcriptional activator/DNA repair enzyme Ada [Limisphaerales bacterium]MCS1415095.1 Bifunctional transcriptional activator/DNA repair enzyme Ada [Limisphaerales bacterium]